MNGPPEPQEVVPLEQYLHDKPEVPLDDSSSLEPPEVVPIEQVLEAHKPPDVIPEDENAPGYIMPGDAAPVAATDTDVPAVVSLQPSSTVERGRHVRQEAEPTDLASAAPSPAQGPTAGTVATPTASVMTMRMSACAHCGQRIVQLVMGGADIPWGHVHSGQPSCAAQGPDADAAALAAQIMAGGDFLS